jgi:NADPH:quinone reductase-like Zn-dependent oxidoreductase
VTRAQLSVEESILIHGGAGGVVEAIQPSW